MLIVVIFLFNCITIFRSLKIKIKFLFQGSADAFCTCSSGRQTGQASVLRHPRRTLAAGNSDRARFQPVSGGAVSVLLDAIAGHRHRLKPRHSDRQQTRLSISGFISTFLTEYIFTDLHLPIQFINVLKDIFWFDQFGYPFFIVISYCPFSLR